MSPKMRKIHLEEAYNIGLEILEEIEELYTKAEIAGSVRRRRKFVHDIDIVLIPQLFAFPDRVIMKLRERWPDLEVLRKGSKIVSLMLREGVNIDQGGVSVDLYASETRYFGTHLLRWTGSKEHNIKLCSRARALGLKLAVSRGVERDGQVIASRTEEDIFKALKMDYVAPEEREV